MLIGGKEKLERMRDGRAIYIGAERVKDVTRHAAFKNAAQTIAGLYELKADPDQRELFTFEENGERYGLPWLRCRTIIGGMPPSSSSASSRRTHRG
jgi:4-hydroxyphenylacetate 3-monooxygenase